MREIKFRVWNGERYITKSSVHEENNDKCLMLELDGSLIDIAYDREDDYSNEYIIEQFTGLHDKNGVEIYEGDILSDGYLSTIVHWNYTEAGFTNGVCNWRKLLPHLEVIGNIHNNEVKE